MASFPSPYSHCRSNLRINGPITKGILALDTETLAFRIDRINNEATLEMRPKRRITRHQSCQLSAGAAFGCRPTQPAAFQGRCKPIGVPLQTMSTENGHHPGNTTERKSRLSITARKSTK